MEYLLCGLLSCEIFNLVAIERISQPGTFFPKTGDFTEDRS